MRSLLRPALWFTLIGLVLYGALFAASEALVLRHGRSNPFFKIARTPEPAVDWIVLGASHAMPLDFGDFNAGLQRASGQRIVQLAGPGTGPLYNRLALEQFLHEHRARHLLYVVDAFAFQSRTWNEDRIGDVKLLRRTPCDAELTGRLARYVRDEGVDVRALLDYATGFSKINNRERFERDVWEGEAQFDRVAPRSSSAIAKRIAYLYPSPPEPEALAVNMARFASLLALARQHGMRTHVIQMPLPPAFRKQLPDATAFDAALARVIEAEGASHADFSATIDDPRLYFDTDHLNRAGLGTFVERSLMPILMQGAR